MFCWPSWRHQTETFSSLLAICEANPPVTGGLLTQRPVRRKFYVFFVLRLFFFVLHPSAASSSSECLKSQMKTLNKKSPLNISSELDWCWISRYQNQWWLPGSRSRGDQSLLVINPSRTRIEKSYICMYICCLIWLQRIQKIKVHTLPAYTPSERPIWCTSNELK